MIGIKIMNEPITDFQVIFDKLDLIDAKLDILEMKIFDTEDEIENYKEKVDHLRSAFVQKFGNY